MTNEELLKVISQLDSNQREALEKYVAFESYQDIESANLSELKKKIYKKYSKDISDLVAKTEVYVHDLPRLVCGLIETVFRILAASSAESVEADQMKICSAALKYELFLIDTLQILLILRYTKEIKQYKSLLKKFNNKRQFMKETDESLKILSEKYKQGRKKFLQQYSLNIIEYEAVIGRFSAIEARFPGIGKLLPRDLEVNLDFCNKIKEFDDCVEEAEKAVKCCEDNYAAIINSGYSSTLFKRCVSFIPKLISFALALRGAKLIFEKWM